MEGKGRVQLIFKIKLMDYLLFIIYHLEREGLSRPLSYFGSNNKFLFPVRRKVKKYFGGIFSTDLLSIQSCKSYLILG